MMNKVIILMIMMLGTSLLNAQTDQGIHFEHGTWAEIKAKAKNENKLIFMDCYTDWCGPCKYLSKTIFTQKKVGDYFNAHYISYKVDMEKGEGIELRKQFDVRAYPTLLFFNSDGELNFKRVGAVSGDQLIDDAQMTPKRAEKMALIKKDYDNNPKDLAAVKAYLDLLIAGKDKQSVVIAEEYFSLLPKSEWTKADNIAIMQSQIKDPWSPVVLYILDNKESFNKVAGNQVVDDMLENTFYEESTRLVNEVKNGEPFDEAAFKKLASVMEERQFDKRTDVVFDTEMRVLTIEKNWVDYMVKVKQFFDERGMANLDYIQHINRYLYPVLYDSNDTVILNEVLNYLEGANHTVKNFSMLGYNSLWNSKTIVLEKLDRQDELKVVQNQLELLRTLRVIQKEAYESGKLLKPE
jgi:thioredoxin-related protein